MMDYTLAELVGELFDILIAPPTRDERNAKLASALITSHSCFARCYFVVRLISEHCLLEIMPLFVDQNLPFSTSVELWNLRGYVTVDKLVSELINFH